MAPYIESFDGYTPNIGVEPTGFHEISIFHGQVINHMGRGKGTAAQGYQLGLSAGVWGTFAGSGVGSEVIGAGHITDDGGNAKMVVQYFEASSLPSMRIAWSAGGTSPEGLGYTVCSFDAESDSSVSIYVNTGGPTLGPQRMGNSPTAANLNILSFVSWQVIWKFTAAQVLHTAGTTTTTTTNLGVAAAVWRDGTFLFVTPLSTTGIELNTIGGALTDPDQWFITGDRNLIDSLFFQWGLVTNTASNTSGIPQYFLDTSGMIWPFSGTGGGTGQIPPVFSMNVSQTAYEPMKQYSPAVRASQTAVEIVKNHDTIARVSQTAVEIILRNGNRGWAVYEA